MIWVKENFEKFSLLFVALALLACSVFQVYRTLNFHKTLKGVSAQMSRNAKVEAVDVAELMEAFEIIEAPEVWTEFTEQSLFSAERYIEQDGRLVKPHAGNFHAPITNEWLEQYGLDVLDTTLKEQDMDSDGFSVLEEFHARTSPIDEEAHPAYWTKLRLKRYLRRRFRLIFSAYTGNPEASESLTFQLNMLDLRQPTQFLSMGDHIVGTDFRIVGFEKKTQTAPFGLIKDVSELTVENIEDGSRIVLVLEQIAHSPDSFGLFKYLWDGSEFAVRQRKTFRLKPDEKRIFELIEITNTKAIIEDIRTGEKHQVPLIE